MNRERWGKRRKDKRDWVAYNEELVVRATFYLDLDWVRSWNAEVRHMNEGKVGSPYVYPDSMINLQGLWYMWTDYRGVEGITRCLAEEGLIPQYNDFSTINRRLVITQPSFRRPPKNNTAVACDGSGMKFGVHGEHLERIYGRKKRKYAKVVITTDAKTKDLLAVDVSVLGEDLSEPQIAVWNMRIFKHRGFGISAFVGDGSFDTIELFKYLEENGTESIVKLRGNSVVKSDGSLRDKEVLLYKKLGYKKWAKKKRYGMRWPATEGVFSAVKRKFGEQTRSHRIENALNEIAWKFWAYQKMKDYARRRA